MSAFKKLRRKFGLARRYGHSMADVSGVMTDVRKVARENSMITAGMVGASAGALTSTMGVGPAAVVGGVIGIALEEVIKK